MEVAVYARVSTERAQQAQTIQQQIERLQAHVTQQPNWHLAEAHIYRDDGYSGAQLNRPGLDHLRDHAGFAEFELVLITAPDRLARKYVHQVLIIEELQAVGCRVEFLERPMSDDTNDQLLLQIRAAVAEYERTLIAERMRRGRQAKLRSGRLLPWTRPPYGYVLDSEQPRVPNGVRLEPVQAAIIEQIFAWYTQADQRLSLYEVAKRLSESAILTPTGCVRWNVATVRGILRNPAYTGTAYSGRTIPMAARQRKSALLPVGPGYSQRPTPPDDWIAIPVPAIITQETFDLAQVRLDQNKQFARRNNVTHDYLLRGLVSCAQCHLACTGIVAHPGGSAGEIVRNVLVRPFAIARTILLEGGGAGYLVLLFVPLLATPLAGIEFLLPGLADLGANLLSANAMPRSLFAYHSISLMPVLVAAGIHGASRIASRWRRYSAAELTKLVLWATLLLSYFTSPLPLRFAYNYWKLAEWPFKSEPALAEIRELIPPTASVSAQANVGAHFSQRYRIEQFSMKAGEADFIVLRLASATRWTADQFPAIFGSLAHHLGMPPAQYLDTLEQLLHHQ